MLLSEGETVPLSPFIVPRVIKIFGEIPSREKKKRKNVFSWICDVSRMSVPLRSVLLLKKNSEIEKRRMMLVALAVVCIV